MKTILLAVMLMFCLNLAQAQEHTHTKHSKVGRKAIKYQGENKYKPTLARKKAPKKFMFAGENMHPDKRFR